MPNKFAKMGILCCANIISFQLQRDSNPYPSTRQPKRHSHSRDVACDYKRILCNELYPKTNSRESKTRPK